MGKLNRVQKAVLALAYVSLMALVVFGMLRGRRWSRQQLNGSTATQQWQSFRDDVEAMNESSPVRRRIPQSDEPPALVLTRDYFVACLVIALVLTTALFVTCAFFIVGVWNHHRAG